MTQQEITPPNYLCHEIFETNILFELTYKNVAHKFKWEHHSKFGEVLKPIYTNKPIPFAELNLSEMYREFLGILQPFSDFGISPTKWIETLDANSDYMMTLSENEYLQFKASGGIEDLIKLRILEHAENYGFGSNKVNGNMLPTTLKGLLTIPQSFKTDDNNPRHRASYKSIVRHAIHMYDCITLTTDEIMEDEVIANFLNQNEAKVTLGYETKGLGILISGYWACLWWGFLLDKQRLKVTKCANCNKVIVGANKHIKTCSAKCRSKINHQKNKLIKLIKTTKAMKETKERKEMIKDLTEAIDCIENAMKNQ